jgi:hypothetical protein
LRQFLALHPNAASSTIASAVHRSCWRWQKTVRASSHSSARPTFPPSPFAGNVLTAHGRSYDFSGRDRAGDGPSLTPIAASQEFFHSWLSFHPATQKAEPAARP